MSGLIAIRSSTALAEQDNHLLLDSINLSGNLDVLSSIKEQHFFAVASLKNTPLKGARLHEDSTWLILFAGDLVHQESIPHGQIINALASDVMKLADNLEGIFALVAYNKIEDVLYAVSDRRSQQPLYYFADHDGIDVGTDMSTFCRLRKKLCFHKEWLWQYLFFNFPVDGTTFLQDVKRLPPASVLRYDCSTHKLTLSSYAEPFKAHAPLLTGQDALQRAARVFAERIPGYYQGADQVACALTGGWDGRTMLALAPSSKNISCYTYGCPGCGDITRASRVAQALHIKHIPIPFDESLVGRLPHHMLETVYLSAGLQNVLRSTLHYAYDKLTHGGRRFPLAISGISLDMQFRGHAALPSLISDEMAARFRGGDQWVHGELWSRMIGAGFSEFNQTIQGKLDDLAGRFGPFKNAEHHLSYILYVLSTEYFCGELKIAGHYTTVRVPSWDSAVIELAYSIEQSTLSYSQFLAEHSRGSREEMVLQAYLLKELAPHIYPLAIGHTRPAIVLAGDLTYQAYRIARGLTGRMGNKFSTRAEAPLEDWRAWIFHHHQAFVEELLFSPDSQIRHYIKDDFLRLSVANLDKHFVGKFMTAEIILRLIKNGWARFW